MMPHTHGQRAKKARQRPLAGGAVAGAESGFSLVELMISLLIISIGISALATVFAASIRTATVAAHRNDAVTLAVRDIETIRAIPYGELGFAASVAGYAQPSPTAPTLSTP